MQLALMVQLPPAMGGLGGGVGAVYIATEGAFAAARLLEMIAGVHELFGRGVAAIPFAERVFLQHCYGGTDGGGPAELLDCVRRRLPALMARQRIGLVVVDSVAAVFRTETQDVRARALQMRALVGDLMRLQRQHGCAVVCVNQVAEVPTTTTSMAVGQQTAQVVVPCLGLAWANLVTHRLQLHRSAGAGRRRSMEVVFSPELPRARADFVIASAGVCDAPASDDADA